MALLHPSDAPSGRLAFVHGLRGVAALLVVWAHLGSLWLAIHGETSLLDRGYQQLVVRPFHVFQNGGHLGVVLFFLISGFIITFASLREDRTSFAVKRVLRLGPPLAVALLVGWLYVQLCRALGFRLIGVADADPLEWLSALFLLDGFFFDGGYVLAVSWTLVIEVVFYTMTFALLGLTRTRPEAATWAMIGVWAVLTVVSMVLMNVAPSPNLALGPYVGFLLVGRCIHLWTAGLIRPLTAALMSSLCLLLFLLFTETQAPGFLLDGGGLPGTEPLVTYAFALIVFLALMAAAPARTVQPFTLLGDVSYSLYLLHMPVGMVTFDLLEGSGTPYSLVSLIAIAASVAAAWLSFVLVERPSQRLARSWLGRRRAARAARVEPLVAQLAATATSHSE